jgi:hypothetical protein
VYQTKLEDESQRPKAANAPRVELRVAPRRDGRARVGEDEGAALGHGPDVRVGAPGLDAAACAAEVHGSLGGAGRELPEG